MLATLRTACLHLLNTARKSARSSFNKRFRRRTACLALIINLLIWPGAGLTSKQFSAFAATGYIITTGPARLTSFIFKSLFSAAPAAPQHEGLADRLAYVAHVTISPEKFVGYVDETVTFSALPTDAFDRTVQGIKFTWESSNPNKIEIDDAGRARFLEPGLARLTCRAGSAEATAHVLIRPNHRPIQSDQQWRADQANLGFDGNPKNGPSTGGLLPALIEKLSPTAYAQSGYNGTDNLYDELWSDPANLTGRPRNRAAEATTLATVLPEGSNYNLAIPLVSLVGRGINTNLTLYYNSRVWSRHGNAVTYDAIASWPSPGFSLGFGRMLRYPVYSSPGVFCCWKYMYVEGDGTRHYLGLSTGPLKATDGSQITYGVYYSDGSGSLYLPNGSQITIQNVNNRLLPTAIMDRNGNYIQIAYKPDCYQVGSETYCGVFPPLAIDYITDTLGRIIQFEYDSGGKLTKIKTPGYGGTTQNPVTTTLVQFDYAYTHPLYNFSGLTVDGPTPYFYALRGLYFPATATGYLFTYSDYGMIYNFSLRRQMSLGGWPPTVIQYGVETASGSFNYPTSTATALTDVPAFTQRTETAVNSSAGVYNYSRNRDDVAKRFAFSITQPDSTTLLLTRSTDSASPANGLLIESELKNGSASIAKTVYAYANDPGGCPAVQSETSYDDALPTPNQLKIDVDYDSYGNIVNKREYGFQVGGSWQVRRRTHYTYHSSLIHSVILVEVFDAKQNTVASDDVLIAKTSYAYDNYVAMGGVENYPTQANAPNHINMLSGNVTGVSEWTDLATNTTITHLAKYDLFGNVVKAQVSCCMEKDLTNMEATYWSRPQEEMSGDPNGIHETTSTDYDFNTSLVKSRTDAAGLVTNYSHDATMRQSGVALATGASSGTNFDYGTLSSTSSISYYDGDVLKTITSTAQYDGWGRMIQAVDANGAQVNTTYNAMGRVTSRTNPFPSVGQPGPATSFQYDLLGRLTITTLPDGNTVRDDYNGVTVTSTDQVGRKIKQERDGLGRLVKVTEQDAAGSLTQETTYSHNLLDKLLSVSQGAQSRSYKYDDMGRLLYEKIPEQSPTINDGTGTYWSCKYTYTEFNAIATKQDARGVVTSYTYDTLHRQSGVSYNTANAQGVAETPSVGFGYTSTGKLSQVYVSATSTTPNSYQENYAYDQYNRIQSVTRWILGQAYDIRKTYTTSYEYNGASQLTKLTYPSGMEVNLGYDSQGRLISLPYDPAYPQGYGYMSNVTYHISGQVSGLRLGNGVTESFGYDQQRLQVTTQTATANGGATGGLLNLTYGYTAQAGQSGAGTTAGNAGHLMSVSGSVAGQAENASYTYDQLSRLSTSNQTVNAVATQRRFGYDRWGNRTSVWDSVSGGNQIQTVALEQSGGAPTNRVSTLSAPGLNAQYTYDAAGNVTSDGAHTYQYDAENRVVSIDGGSSVKYRYDHRNRRVCKIVGSSWTHYIWEGGQIFAEHDATTPYGNFGDPPYQVRSARADYIYAATRMIYSKQRVSSVAQWTARYHVSDRLSVRITTDASGNVLGRQGHLPFGEETGASGTQDKHHFTSYERDAESGADYALNRGYLPGVGRFLSSDPYQASGYMTNPQSWNRYSYVLNNPVNYDDPDGLGLRVIVLTPQFCYLFPWLCNEGPAGGSPPRDGETRNPLDPPIPPEKKPETQGYWPGFDQADILDINRARAEGFALLTNTTGDPDITINCRNNLNAKDVHGKHVNADTLINRLLILPVKSDTEDPDQPGAFNLIFNGDTSRWSKVKERKGKDTAITFGSPGTLQFIFLFKDFFNEKHPNSKINLVRSQAIVLIHESIHLQGFSDRDFGGSDKIDTFIIQSCINPNWTFRDMAL